MTFTKQTIETVTLINEFSRKHGGGLANLSKSGLVTVKFPENFAVRGLCNEFCKEVLGGTGEWAVDTHNDSDEVTIDLSYNY